MTWLIATTGYGLTAATFGILWILLIARSLQGERRYLLLLAPALTVFWALANITAQTSDLDPALPNLFQVMHSSGWLLVIHQLIERPAAARLRERVIILTISLLTLASAVGTLANSGYGSSIVIFFGGGMCLLQVAGLLILENIYRNADEERRWALKHLLLGCATMQVFDLMLFAEVLLFGSFDATYGTAQGFVDALAAPLIAISVMRYRSWKVDLHVSRDVVYHSTVLILAGIYLLLVAAAGYYLKKFGGDWGTISTIVIICVAIIAFLIAMSSASMRARLRLWIGTHFFSHKYDYRKEWLRFTDTLSDSGEGISFHQRLLRSIGDIVDSTGGGIWLHHLDDKAFALETTMNMGDELRALPETHPLITHLRETGRFVDLFHQTAENEGLELPGWLAGNKKAWLILPLNHMDRLIGFVILARPRVPHVLDREDADLLRVVSQQVASYAAEERSLRTLEDSKKLEDFNKRFAFVVHDLKNAISQLSMMLKNAEKHSSNPEFQKDMMNTVENTVQRMQNMMERLKADHEGLAGNGETGIAPVVLNKVLLAMFQQFAKQHETLALNIPDQAVSHTLDRRKLQTVLTHLLTNAIEASGTDGEVSLNLTSDNEGNKVISVADDGPGMTEDFIRNELFKPLNSSKADGFGIGAYQVKQLVRDLGGRLEVISSPGQGTDMQIHLESSE